MLYYCTQLVADETHTKTAFLFLENSVPENYLIRLEILRREWGVEVKSLIEAFDGIVKGTVAPVETLISAAQLGDRRAVHERAKTLNTYRNILKEISTTSISRYCKDISQDIIVNLFSYLLMYQMVLVYSLIFIFTVAMKSEKLKAFALICKQLSD